MLEKSLENKCRTLVIQHKGLLIKILPFSFTGLPDRLCILPHRPMFFIEFKRLDKKPSKVQRAVHKLLLKLGQMVYTCDNYELFKVILLKHLNMPVYDFKTTSETIIR